jgi:hypothetical protein
VAEKGNEGTLALHEPSAAAFRTAAAPGPATAATSAAPGVVLVPPSDAPGVSHLTGVGGDAGDPTGLSVRIPLSGMPGYTPTFGGTDGPLGPPEGEDGP